jgi:nickel-type superoxide dismutase maturation protease
MSPKRGGSRPLFFILGSAAGFLSALAVARIGQLLGGLDAVEVEGLSMVPTLMPGERLLVETWTYRAREPRPGELVLAGDPRTQVRELVKRVASVIDRHVELRGDAPTSTDSRTFGTLPVEQIRWRVAFRYWPPSRVGPVR